MRLPPLLADLAVLGSNYPGINQLTSGFPTYIREVVSTAYRRRGRMAYKFEVFKDSRGEFRFRFKAPNGEIMFSGEGYKKKQSAISAIESIKKNVATADVEDQSK